MANNEYINKVEYGNNTLMDITDTTAESEDVIEGQVFYAKSGARSVGTLGDATTSAHGLMSASDKSKLDDIDLSLYAPKANPIFTGSLSLGRKANTTIGSGSFVVGSELTASGTETCAFGSGNTASGMWATVFGLSSVASGQNAIAMGFGVTASGVISFAEGESTVANFYGAHAMGIHTIASNKGSIAMGRYNYMPEYPAWVKNTSYSVGDKIHRSKMAHLMCIEANSDSTWNESKWRNIDSDEGEIALAFGNGTADNARANALTLDWAGNLSLKKDIYVNANADGTGGTRIPHDIQINGISIVSNGVANIPLASTSNLGLVKIPTGNDQGIGIILNGDSNGNTISTGELTLIMATNAELKVADSTCAYRPISAYKAYRAVFYGLAKASGDTTQSQSNNAVGTYTTEAATSIKTMLQIQEGLEVVKLI